MLTCLEAHCFHHAVCVFWIKVSAYDGESLFLNTVGIFVKNILLFNVSGTTFHNTSVPTCMQYTTFYWLLLQLIYMKCALLLFWRKIRYNIRNVCNYLPGDKESHSNKKHLEKSRDLKMYLQAISFKIPREFIKFYISCPCYDTSSVSIPFQ